MRRITATAIPTPSPALVPVVSSRLFIMLCGLIMYNGEADAIESDDINRSELYIDMFAEGQELYTWVNDKKLLRWSTSETTRPCVKRDEGYADGYLNGCDQACRTLVSRHTPRAEDMSAVSQ